MCRAPPASRVSGTWRSATASATAASGTLIRNTRRQDPASTSQPPKNGPTALETPASPDHAPTARARSSGWKVAEMIERLPGTRRAPATPWTALAAMRNPMVGATAHSAEAMPNAPSPATNIRRRP